MPKRRPLSCNTQLNIWQLMLRHASIFYPHRAHFAAGMVHSLLRCGSGVCYYYCYYHIIFILFIFLVQGAANCCLLDALLHAWGSCCWLAIGLACVRQLRPALAPLTLARPFASTQAAREEQRPRTSPLPLLRERSMPTAPAVPAPSTRCKHHHLPAPPPLAGWACSTAPPLRTGAWRSTWPCC